MHRKILLVICIITLFSGYQLNLSAQEKPQNSTEFVPDIDGILKTKVEFDLDNSKMRFEVRNARFGAKGKVNDYFSYRAEIDLSDEGNLKMLDAYVRFTPLKNLDLYMGQRKLPFSTDYIRNPAEGIFANRSFVAKYVNDGLRDIGFYIDYRFGSKIPFNLTIGAVNGTGNNNPQWIDRPNIVSRLIAGGENNFRIAANIYEGEAANRVNLLMTGWEARYKTEKFLIETEFVTRNWNDTLSANYSDQGFYIHSYYSFTTNSKMLQIISPAIRLDRMGNNVFGSDVTADRLTLGINFGFEPKLFYADFKVNYENYFSGYLPNHTDKITFEFIARF
jgi:hypothetical protein